MRRFFRRIFQMASHSSERRPTRRPGVTFRPRLEGLEAREVPALCTWKGTFDTDFDNPLNWNGGVPHAGDDVVFLPRPVATTEEGDPIYGPPRNCDNMHGATGGDGSGEYNSVTLAAAYGGTVTLTTAITTRAFGLHSGTIDQPSAAYTIPVVGAGVPYAADFYWTAGTLNTIDNGAEVNVDGATGLIDSGGATLSTASTLNVVSGALVTLLGGTLEFSGGAGMYIDARVDFKHSADIYLAVSTVGGANPKQVEFAANGVLGLFKVNPMVGGNCTSALPILNKGTLQIQDGIELNVSGNIGGANGPSIKQESGLTYWTTGANIRAISGMTVTGGSVQFIVVAGNPKAPLAGDFTFEGEILDGDAILFQGYGQFEVQGHVTWTGGTYKPAVDGTDGTKKSQWIATKTFKIGAYLNIGIEPQFAPGTEGAAGEG